MANLPTAFLSEIHKMLYISSVFLKRRFFACFAVSIVGIIFLITPYEIYAQRLTPHFDKNEFEDLFKLNLGFKSIEGKASIPIDSFAYDQIYTSKSLGLDNQWSLWKHKEKNVAAICIRGTGPSTESWLENIYAAMVPAKGELILSEKDTFRYKLAEHPRAAVHVGWLVGVAFLSKEILPKIDSLYKTDIKDFYLIGHSQGGALVTLLHAYLKCLQLNSKIPNDLIFKTYASAAPKTGNLYFAYYFEHITQNGYAFNVVNTADWVPEVPLSIQTLDDFNEVNPLSGLEEAIKKTGFFRRVALKSIYKNLKKPMDKARNKYQKYLGEEVSKMIRKSLPNFQPPEYFNSNHYMRVGRTIVLYADEEYYKEFPADPKSEYYIFTHHLFEPYKYLLDKL
ncbi:MAG: lipase family protein [Xanthomarina gelatinilytica]|uniref:lipase family protein n=1 Tax=Xanthomarina gelatinilytica TaxID=1137281 RepID=UPI003A8A2EAB